MLNMWKVAGEAYVLKSPLKGLVQACQGVDGLLTWAWMPHHGLEVPRSPHILKQVLQVLRDANIPPISVVCFHKARQKGKAGSQTDLSQLVHSRNMTRCSTLILVFTEKLQALQTRIEWRSAKDFVPQSNVDGIQLRLRPGLVWCHLGIRHILRNFNPDGVAPTSRRVADIK